MSSVPSALIRAAHGGPEQLIEAVGLATQGRPDTDCRWASVSRRACKRAVDIIGAGLGLMLLFPLLLAISLLIRLSSPGPALFRQTRLGLNGRTFELYKFRTMVVDAEQRLREIEHLNESEGGVLFKVRRDPRVTRIGRILRRTSLDELPQLINVLRGEMSLVGPRPLQLRDCLLLARAEPEGFIQRHKVPPGLTGLWQVSDRSQTGFAHMIRLDLEYIDRWSLGFDLRLLVQTFTAVIFGRGIC